MCCVPGLGQSGRGVIKKTRVHSKPVGFPTRTDFVARTFNWSIIACESSVDV